MALISTAQAIVLLKQKYKYDTPGAVLPSDVDTAVSHIYKELTKLDQESGGSSPLAGYKIVSGVLRNTGSGWGVLDDNDHIPLNIDSVSNNTSAITIDYSSLNATKVVSLVACPDETFAGKYDFGASVGKTSSSIAIKNIQRTHEILITHTGNGVFTFVNQDGSDATGFSYTYNPIDGRLDFTHNEMEGSPVFYDMVGNTDIRSGLNTLSKTVTYMKFYNHDGTQQTLADPEVGRFTLQQQSTIGLAVNPNDLVSAGGNIWIIGILEV